MDHAQPMMAQKPMHYASERLGPVPIAKFCQAVYPKIGPRVGAVIYAEALMVELEDQV
jgi:hypothetical protein